MRNLILSPLVLALACGGDTEPTDDPLSECACGSPLSAVEMAEPFEDKLAELSPIACRGVPSFRGECSDGKSVLFIDGGFGHTALYYVDQQLVGTSRSTDIYMQGCPSNTYRGALEDVTCEVVSAEPLCPSSPFPGGSQTPESLEIPFADGQLSSWCEAQQ
jgi:hypothetical protein